MIKLRKCVFTYLPFLLGFFSTIVFNVFVARFTKTSHLRLNYEESNSQTLIPSIQVEQKMFQYSKHSNVTEDDIDIYYEETGNHMEMTSVEGNSRFIAVSNIMIQL